MAENGGGGAASSSHVSFEGGKEGERRVADMQLGRCKWVRILDNIAYIVSGLIFREHEGRMEVLLVKEAKKKVYGKWYMPAGHVEAGETIEAATKREVLEETGFVCDVEGLVSLEVRGSGWYRFAFLCTVTGGTLKTQPDRESLEAAWHPLEVVMAKGLELRASDFLKLLEEALKFRQWKTSLPPEVRPQAPVVMNRDENERGLFAEFVIVKVGTSTTEVLVHQSIHRQEDLLTRDDAFPTVEFGFEYFFPVMVSKVYKHILQDGGTVMNPPSAVIATTCLPAPLESFQHGIRTRILCFHKNFAKSPLMDERRYHWLSVSDVQVLSALCLAPAQFRPKLFLL